MTKATHTPAPWVFDGDSHVYRGGQNANPLIAVVYAHKFGDHDRVINLLKCDTVVAIEKALLASTDGVVVPREDEKFIFLDYQDDEFGYNSARDCCDGKDPHNVIRIQRAKLVSDVFGVWFDDMDFRVFETEKEANEALEKHLKEKV